MPELNKVHDLTNNGEFEPSVLSSILAIGQLDDASLTSSATATLLNAPDQVQTAKGRGRGGEGERERHRQSM